VGRALQEFEGAPPEVWLYRGAWEEWSIEEANVLVPLSGDAVRLKLQAIFKHESQKDRAPFPGPDEREFWERVEDRNRGTARDFEQLGFPAYYAMEAYVVTGGKDLAARAGLEESGAE
jgi:glucosamine-6-phosphate deaminase